MGWTTRAAWLPDGPMGCVRAETGPERADAKQGEGSLDERKSGI